MGYAPPVAARGATDEETEALSCWSARWLSSCLSWAARRALRPPATVVEALRQRRFVSPAGLDAAHMLLSAGPDRRVPEANRDQEREAVAVQLSEDIDAFRRWTRAAGANAGWSLRSGSRDLHRMRVTTNRLGHSAFEFVTAAPLVVTVFVPATATLYLPIWLANSLPARMFEPTTSLRHPRTTSLTWVFFEAVVAPAPTFSTVMDTFGSVVHDGGPMSDISIRINGGNIGQFNVKSLVENLNSRVTALDHGGAADTAQAVRTLAETLGNAEELTEQTRKEVLENLGDLAEQAELPTEQRRPGRIKAALAMITQAAAAASSVAEAARHWTDVLAHNLLG